MQGKIGLEEHFALTETLEDSRPFVPADYWPELESRLLDIQKRRIELMDRHGMQMMILSLNAPAIQVHNLKHPVGALDALAHPG